MSDPDRSPDMTPLRKKVSVGTVQHFGASVLVRLLAILMIAVLARLLTPDDFGIFAYAVFATTLVETGFFRHFSVTLIRLPEVTRTHLDTLFSLRILTGTILGCVIIALAAPVANWVNTPELKAVLYWMAAAQMIAACISPRFALLERALNFAPAAFQVVAVRAVTTVLAIILGFTIGNHWALVTGLVVAPVLTVLHSYWVAPYRPRLSLAASRDFMSFGLWVSFSTLLNFLSTRSDRIILGPTLGVAAVGLYRMGVDLAEIGAQQLAQPMERAIYPALASKGKDQASLSRAYLSTQAVVLGLVLPMGLLTALCAQEILRLIAGPQWLDAAVVIWVLAPLLALNTLEGGVRALLYVNDAPKQLFIRNLIVFIAMGPVLLLGVSAGGFLGVVIAAAVLKTMTLLLTLRLAQSQTGKSFLAPFRRAWRSLVASIILVLGVGLLINFMPPVSGETSIGAALQSLTMKCVFGSVLYLGTHFVLWRNAGRPDGLESFLLTTARRGLERFRDRD